MSKTLLQQAADLVILIAEAAPSDSIVRDLVDQAKILAPKLKKKPAPPTEEEIDTFNLFRKAYSKGGTVNGCIVEMNNFCRHEDWREVLPLLLQNLERQRKERAAMHDAGMMVPQWRNLRTWINQRGWETVHFTIPEEKFDINEWYQNFLRRYVSQKFSMRAVVEMAMTEAQFQDYANGAGYFVMVNKEWSHDRKREEFIKSHDKFFTDGLVRQKHLTVGAYIKFKLTGK